MKTINQTINLTGFVSNIEIELDDFLLPLQEVIINSIQSLEDNQNISEPSIGINIIRNIEHVLSEDGFEKPYYPISSFEVTDNGIGFTEKRFNAFNEIYTDLNKAKGCKGIGRYSVLACFNSMNIESTYQENNQWEKRSFKFSAKDGVMEHGSLDETIERKMFSTKVTLNDYKKEFYDYIAKNKITIDNISEAIINHCLLYFISEKIPLIRIFENGEKDKAIIINDFFKNTIKQDMSENTINIKGSETPFTLHYIRNYSSKSHSMHLCANNREVGKKISISKYIPSFVKSIEDEDEAKYFLSVYITGELLDNKVNSQRTKFSIPYKEDEKTMFESISLSEIFKSLSNDIRTEYKDFIDNAEKEKEKRIQEYILDKKSPRLAYRHLIGVQGAFESIPTNASNEKIEIELHKKVFQLEQERTKAFEIAFSKNKYDKDEFSEIIQSVLSEEAKFSADKLADLMIRRKAVLKLFRMFLEWREEDQKYMLEKDLHNIIFTMGAETNNTPNEYHNLWILDERLAYYRYTTSDRALHTNPHIGSDSKKEPDLMIYDFPWAYTDNPNNANSLVIFEFKRPGRDMNTSDSKKLDIQVVEYFERLLESKATNNKGKLLNIEKTTPKFGYVICEMHKDLIEYNKDYNGFKETPYKTLFKINDNLNMYIEVMSYETMLEFAEKRHSSFFQALGIDNL